MKKKIIYLTMLLMMISMCFCNVYGMNLNEEQRDNEIKTLLYLGDSNEKKSTIIFRNKNESPIKKAVQDAEKMVDNATDSEAKDVGNNLGIGNLDNYKGGNIGSTTKVTDKVGEVLGYIRVIGMIVSVGVLMALGIKYMAGSVEEKASYKHSMIPYLIGAAILFSGTLLPSMIYDISHNLG